MKRSIVFDCFWVAKFVGKTITIWIFYYGGSLDKSFKIKYCLGESDCERVEQVVIGRFKSVIIYCVYLVNLAYNSMILLKKN